MTVGSNPGVARAEAPAAVAASVDTDRHMNQPQLPRRVQVHGEETIGVASSGRDPVTGRRYPGGVYTESGVGVGVGDPRNPDSGVGGPAPQATARSVYDRLVEKALPEGRTMEPVRDTFISTMSLRDS